MTLVLVGAGVSTALGGGLGQMQVALAGGRASAVGRLADFRGADFQPQRAAFLDWPTSRGVQVWQRLQGLMLAALEDVQVVGVQPQVTGWIARHGYDLEIVLPEIPGLEDAVSSAMQIVTDQVGAPPMGVTVRASAGAGLAEALAQRRVAQAAAALLVLSADSFANEERLNGLNDAGRMFSRQNPWGLVPGEAASALLFVPDDAAAGLQGLAVTGASVAVELVGEDHAADSAYQGLTAACQTACEGLNDGAIIAWDTDCNNARYRAAELSYTALRIGTKLASDCEVRHLSGAIGDIGAALPAVALALHWHDNAQAGPLLVTGSGQISGKRGAIVARRSPAPTA